MMNDKYNTMDNVSIHPMIKIVKNAISAFISNITEQFVFNSEEARTILDVFIKTGVVKLDPVGGVFNLRDDKFWNPRVLRDALIIGHNSSCK